MLLPLYQLGIFELAQVMVQQMACLLVDYKSLTTLIRDPVYILPLPSVNIKITPVSFRDSHLSLNLVKVSKVSEQSKHSTSQNLRSSLGRGDVLLKGSHSLLNMGISPQELLPHYMHNPTINRELHQEIDAVFFSKILTNFCFAMCSIFLPYFGVVTFSHGTFKPCNVPTSFVASPPLVFRFSTLASCWTSRYSERYRDSKNTSNAALWY